MNKNLQAEASVKDKIKNALNAYTPLLRENFKSTFVTLQSGKNLSKNDFTDAYKAKLDSIQAGAQVNVIENISVNGVNASIDNKTANITLSGASDNNFTDAYKNKLEGIQAGAEKNLLNGVAFTGAEYDYDTATKVASVTITGGNNFVINNHTVKSASIEGANVTFDNDKANISIIGGEGAANFTVNGAEVSAMSVTGAASVSTASDTAIVSIQGGVNEVSIVGGAIQASIEGGKLFLLGSNATVQKASAEFSLSTDNISLPAYTNATISASRLGDGIIKVYDDRFIKAEQINATEFRIIPQYAGSGNVGFWLDETEQYYGAAKNVAVTSNDPIAAILMHFNDSEQPFLNSGYAQITGTSGVGTPIISADYGKFGNGFGNNGRINALISTALGGKDFTFDFWTRSPNFGLQFTDNQSIEFSINSTTQKLILFLLDSTVPTDITLLESEMQHLALCYKHDLSKWYFFYNGALVQEITQTFPRKDTRQIIFYSNPDSIIDELRILDGVCAWTENFTPPTQPYN